MEFDGRTLAYRADILVGGRWRTLTAERDRVDDPGWDVWNDLNEVTLTIGDSANASTRSGVQTTSLRLGWGGVRTLLASIEPIGAHGFVERAEVMRQFLAESPGNRISVFD
jgi:hypothetical protein